MKRLIRSIMLVVLCLSMNSCFHSCENLHFSPVAAIDFSKFEESDGYSESNNGGSLIGPQFGIDVISPINPQWSLESGLRFAAKGNKTSFDSDSDSFEGEAYSFEDKTRLNYIDVPVLARYQIGGNGFSVYGGVQPSLLLSANQKSSGSESENQSMNLKDSFKTLDMAGSLGVGYQFKNGIQLNLGYDHGFSNIAKSNAFGMGNINNRTFKLSVGYALGRKKSK